MLTGYIDESTDSRSCLYTLSCLTADHRYWQVFGRRWQAWLNRKNEQLKAEGRPQISAYHATDCSNRVREFEGWSIEETRDCTRDLLSIFKTHPCVITSYSVDLKEIAVVFPEASEKQQRNLGNIILLLCILDYLSKKILSDPRWPEELLALVHEHGDYDAVLLDAFNNKMLDPSLKYRDKFLSITAMGAEKCILLQAADFVAYETSKAIDRELKGHKRRKSLELLLDLNSVGGKSVKLGKEGIEHFRNNLRPEAMQTLFRNARMAL